jgi:hypothetical protein
MLVQHVGAHSLLVTFEHNEDPADRPTMVIDARDGIALRRYEWGALTVLTELRPMTENEALPKRPRFAKVEG